MEQWSGQIAVITGASSGIGAATAIELALAGMIVIGLARRPNLIDSLNNDLSNSTNVNVGKIYGHYCDVTKLDTIKEAFNWIDNEFGRVDVLIHSAGIGRINLLLDDSVNSNSDYELQNIVNTNLMGTIYVTRAAFAIMRRNNNYGHIISINADYGYNIPSNPAYTTFLNSFPASKRGLAAVADVIRIELDAMNNKKIKYTNLVPGWVKTNILAAGDYPHQEQFFNMVNHLLPKDMADSILYILGTPRTVLIQDLFIRPVGPELK